MAPSVSHGISRLENSASPHSPCACHAVQQARPPPLTRRNWRLASTRRPAHGRSQQLSLPLPHLGSSQKPFCMQATDEPRGSSPTGHQSPELRSDEPGSQEKTWRNLRCTSLMGAKALNRKRLPTVALQVKAILEKAGLWTQ